MRYAATLLFLTVIGSELEGQRPPIEFRGHHIGDSIWLHACWESGPEGKKSCYDDTGHKIGDIQAEILYVFKGDRLESVIIGFKPDDYDDLSQAFTIKFGPADTTWTEELQNRMGATFIDRGMRWSDSVTHLNIEKYGSSVERGVAMMFSDETIRALKEQRETAVDRAKEDL